MCIKLSRCSPKDRADPFFGKGHIEFGEGEKLHTLDKRGVEGYLWWGEDEG